MKELWEQVVERSVRVERTQSAASEAAGAGGSSVMQSDGVDVASSASGKEFWGDLLEFEEQVWFYAVERVCRAAFSRWRVRSASMLHLPLYTLQNLLLI